MSSVWKNWSHGQHFYHRFDQSYNCTIIRQQPSPQGNVAQQIEYPHDNSYQVQNNSLNAMNASVGSVANSNWYIDSGATNHITPNFNNLSISSEYRGNDRLAVGNGQTLSISHTGSLYLASHTHPLCNIKLANVLYVPGITKNLLSIAQLT